jgi:MoxR-like ATPase
MTPSPTISSDASPATGADAPVGLPWFDIVAKMLDVSRFVLLVGPPGCGKSTFAQHIARHRTGRPPIVIPGSPQREEIDVWGSRAIVDGETVFEDGPLPMALKRAGTWLVVEEFATIPLETRSTFLELRNADEITNPFTREVLPVPRGNDFRVLATSNPESMNCQRHAALARALFDGILIYEVPPLPESEVRMLLRHHHPAAAAEDIEWAITAWRTYRFLSEAQEKDHADEFVTYRAASQLLALVAAGLDREQAVRIALVNKFITDSDLHAAAKLKHDLS